MAKYKTLMGTPTNKPPSKERKYHIDAYKKGAKHKALEKKAAGGMYGDAAMKKFTANKERKHKQWDREGK